MKSSNTALQISAEQFKQLSKTDPLDWLLTCLFVVTFAAILLVFELVQRLGHLLDLLKVPRICGESYQQWGAIGVNLSLRYATSILGMKIDTSFTTALDPNKNYLFVSNHQSLFDTFLLAAVLKRWNPRFVAKKELGKFIPSISFNLRAGGHALIDRSNPRQAIATLDQFAARALENSYSIIVFPEGTRSRDGSLLPYRSSGFQKLVSTLPQLEVVPVAIDGSWRTAANRKSAIPRGIKVSLDFGPPFSTDHFSADEILEKAREFTADKIGARRG